MIDEPLAEMIYTMLMEALQVNPETRTNFVTGLLDASSHGDVFNFKIPCNGLGDFGTITISPDDIKLGCDEVLGQEMMSRELKMGQVESWIQGLLISQKNLEG